jgi:GR25 family glycosyltransferase involved in LPS biosynthesis
MSSNIDHIFYINLEHRIDRRSEFENEMKIMNLNAERFNAIKCTPGIAGAGYSHLAVLKLAKERGYKNVLIFEDDITFLVNKEQLENDLESFFKFFPDFDVCMIAYNLLRHENIPDSCVNKVIEAQVSAGYIVNAKFYDPLIELLEYAVPILQKTDQHWIYGNDQIWKRLQPMNKWYAFKNRIAKQRPSYSDNTLRFEDSGC